MKQGLLTTIEEMQDDIKQLKKGGGGGGGDYDEDIEQLKRTTAAQSQAIAGNTQDINDLEAFQRTATGQISDMSDDIDGLQSTTNELQSEIDTNAGNISTLSGRMTNAEDDIDTLETTAENHDTRISENATDIDGLDTRVTALEQATPPSPDLSNYYTKTQSDERYTAKATTTALESRVGNVESSIGNIETGLTNRYTKTETDNLLDGYYTKTQSDGRYASQTDLSTTNSNVTTNANDIDGLDTRVTALEQATPSPDASLTLTLKTPAVYPQPTNKKITISEILLNGESISYADFAENYGGKCFTVEFSSTWDSTINDKFTELTESNIFYPAETFSSMVPGIGISAVNDTFGIIFIQSRTINAKYFAILLNSSSQSSLANCDMFRQGYPQPSS